jgi:AcrR family transcriptional regulator
MRRKPSKNIDVARRAEIGAERRARTRMELLAAALELFGRAHGRNTRIEDLCTLAHISRGTFYNYFVGIEPLLEALSDVLTRDFDAAVHRAMDQLPGPLERTSAAIRYYLHGALVDSRWGWAVVNSSVGATLYGPGIARQVLASIQQGIDAGHFHIDYADVGRDIVLGTGISATLSLLHGGTRADYPEAVAHHVLLSLGARPSRARVTTARPMSQLPRVQTATPFFRGTLGGVAHR